VLKDRFYLIHVNKDEDIVFGSKKSIDNTVSWKMNIEDSQDGVAVKVPSISGKVVFEVYGSNELGIHPVNASELRPGDVSPLCRAIHISKLELLYKPAKEENIFGNNTDTADVIYTNVINNEYVNEWDDLELKINTQIENNITSYSSMLLKVDNLEFCQYLYDKTQRQYRLQENNLIEKYYNHYKEPRAILELSVINNLYPYSRVKEQNLNKTFVFDSYNLDLRSDVLKVKLIEYGNSTI
jgi:hypothetical protein